jgi:2-polyprenyl-3-methyl-5-hydroxy-6-metoxy-1,4-benzoquinol methylase
MDRCFLKKILDLFHYNPHQFLFGIFERNARRIYERKLVDLDVQTRTLVEQEDERHHLADMELAEAGSQFVVRSFTIDRIQFLKECGVGRLGIVTDLGDSNGIFLRYLKLDGVSVNISDPTIKSLKSKNLNVVKADVERLPFKSGSISTVMLFETLEHVPNPILLLSEIERVCDDSLILSIPYVSVTKINQYKYNPSIPIFQHHIFEFSPDDFKKIVSHTRFTIHSERVVTVIGINNTALESLVFFFWNLFVEPDMYCGCFRKFYMCQMKKIKST